MVSSSWFPAAPNWPIIQFFPLLFLKTQSLVVKKKKRKTIFNLSGAIQGKSALSQEKLMSIMSLHWLYMQLYHCETALLKCLIQPCIPSNYIWMILHFTIYVKCQNSWYHVLCRCCLLQHIINVSSYHHGNRSIMFL